MADDNELIDPAPLRDSINKKIDELFQFNQKVVEVLRGQAKDFEMVGGFFNAQASRCFEIAAMIVELAAVSAQNTSNIIVAEFGHSEEIGIIDLSIDEEENDDPA